VVEVLLTGKINELSKSFCSDGSVILGYFLSSDLLPKSQGNPGSNEGEVFYSIVPDPNNKLLPPGCRPISLRFAQSNLSPTFIHEFQHMISYGQKVLIGGGTSAEETWLNEGMSHYAEELGGRLIPDSANPTLPPGGNTYTQFALSDFQNASDYLTLPEQTFLIEPRTSNGDLKERGANWLFVRWLVEGFGTATPNPAKPTFTVRATDMTADSLLQYKDLNLRSIYSQLHASDPSVFAQAYPLIPDSTRGTYLHAGTLKQGSARHVRILQAAGAAGVQLLLTGSNRAPIASTIVPRIGLVRIK
jgi:hypothetical protein